MKEIKCYLCLTAFSCLPPHSILIMFAGLFEKRLILFRYRLDRKTEIFSAIYQT